jgi:cation diffusion facilitator CzcD-associated flavoprotein CzcO
MTETATASEHFDVIVVGAGISGLGAAYHLGAQSPGTRYVVLEAMESFGGTWWTHRYPGARSDSDLFTFGYRFKPWVGNPIATGAEIMAYLGEVIADNDLGRHIRYRHKIVSASWSSTEKRWALEVLQSDTGQRMRFTTNFLWMCQGYYRHSEGYTPTWKGMDAFKGRIVHPQNWPRDLDYANKSVVVIGSGATAATLIPAIAPDCAHVTLLQRSPSYYVSNRKADELAATLRQLDVDETWVHEIMRKKYLRDHEIFVRRAFSEPEVVREELLASVREQLGPGADVDPHFTPKYLPLRQRAAYVPNGDIFKAIRSGKASVVTDEIESFTTDGVLLKSGTVLKADIIVTATGFAINVLGDIAFVIDGAPLVFSDTVTYHGMMFTGVPNLVWVFGYFRAAWTLRVDLVADFVCKLLARMKAKGARKVSVAPRPQDADMALLPWVADDNFSPGYLVRGMHLLPKRGDKPEWQHTQDYWNEKDEFPAADLDDPLFVYG